LIHLGRFGPYRFGLVYANHWLETRVALCQGALVRLPLRDTLEKGDNVWVLLQAVGEEEPHGGQGADVHDVGRGEVVAGEPGALRQTVLEHLQRALKVASRELGRGIVGQSVETQLRAALYEGRLEVPVAKVQEVQVVGVVVGGRRCDEIAVAVLGEDVLEDGAGFGQRNVSILDYGCRLARVTWLRVLDVV
jgi:hypothetical protein